MRCASPADFPEEEVLRSGQQALHSSGICREAVVGMVTHRSLGAGETLFKP